MGKTTYVANRDLTVDGKKVKTGEVVAELTTSFADPNKALNAIAEGMASVKATAPRGEGK